MQTRISKAGNFLFHWAALPLLLSAIIQLPTYIEFGQKISGGADALLFLHVFEDNLRLVKGSIFGQLSNFWSPDYFWPMQNTKAWGDHMLLHTGIYGLFRTGLDEPSSWTAWISSLLILNYISLRYFLGKISRFKSPFVLSITSLVTCFSPAITEFMAQPKMLGIFMLPPLLVYIDNMFRSESALLKASDLLGLAIITSASMLITIYTFVFTAFGVICALITRCLYCLTNRRDLISALTANIRYPGTCNYGQFFRNNRAGIFALLSLISLLIVVYFPYLKTMETFGNRGLIDPMQLPQVGSLLQGGSDLLIGSPAQIIQFPEWVTRVSGDEQSLFPGYLYGALFLTSVAIQVFPRLCHKRAYPISTKDLTCFSESTAVQYLLFSIVLWLGILNFGGTSLLSISALFIPGAKALRVPSRVIFVPIILSTPSILNGFCLVKTKIDSIRDRPRLAAPNKDIKKITLWLLTITCIILLSFRSGFFGKFDYGKWELRVKELSELVLQSDCNLIYVMPTNRLHIGERHLLGMHLSQKTRVPTVNGTNAYIPQYGYPYEDLANGNDSQIALGWALAQSNELFYEGSKPITYPIRMCALDPNKKQVHVLDESDAFYPSSPYSDGDFAITRDKFNGLIVVQKKKKSAPIFHRIITDSGIEPIDIYGYTPSGIIKQKDNKLIIIDTPRDDMKGFSGCHTRLIDLVRSKLVGRGYHSAKECTVRG